MDVVTAPREGGGAHVRVFDGVSLAEVRSFIAFDPADRTGVSVAVADVDGDGFADIVTGALGGGSEVRVFGGRTGSLLTSFAAFAGDFSGGVRVAAADVTGDGRADVIAGAGAGGGSNVKVFDGLSGNEVGGFFAYEPGMTAGVTVATADADGDGIADIVTGTGVGGGARVRVFRGRDFTPVDDFFAYSADFRGGVFVAAADLDRDGLADVVTGAGPGGAAHVRAFRSPDGAGLASFFAYDPLATGGPFAGGGVLPQPNTAPTVTDIADLTINANQVTGTIGFTVGDRETPASALVVSVVSSNPILLPPERLSLGGAGENRTVEARPAAGLSGEAVVTVTVADARGAAVSDSFRLTVLGTNPTNTPPTISAFADLRLEPGAPSGPIPFTIDDEETAADLLHVRVSSDNPALVPDAAVTLGGSGRDRDAVRRRVRVPGAPDPDIDGRLRRGEGPSSTPGPMPSRPGSPTAPSPRSGRRSCAGRCSASTAFR